MQNDAKRYVSENMTQRAALEGLAEECCELAQAALKLIRATDGENPTPVSEKACDEKLREEAGDVLMLMELLNIVKDGTTADNPKWERWAKRIMEKKQKQICGATGRECVECVPGGCGSAVVRKVERS